MMTEVHSWVAVVGAGYWGPNLVRNVQATPGLRLRYLCDLDVERARRVLGEYSTVQAVTRRWTPCSPTRTSHAVAVATPAATHHAVVHGRPRGRQARAGREAAAPTLEEGRELVDGSPTSAAWS